MQRNTIREFLFCWGPQWTPLIRVVPAQIGPKSEFMMIFTNHFAEALHGKTAGKMFPFSKIFLGMGARATMVPVGPNLGPHWDEMVSRWGGANTD